MSSGDAPLTTDDHDRGAAGLRWVYPVISQRSGGCSVGVNLNPNHQRPRLKLRGQFR